jgi:hypothetical protein
MLFRARMVLLIVACVRAARRNRVFGDVYFPPVHGFLLLSFQPRYLRFPLNTLWFGSRLLGNSSMKRL